MKRVLKLLSLATVLSPVLAAAQLDPPTLSGGAESTPLSSFGTVNGSETQGKNFTNDSASAFGLPSPLISVSGNTSGTSGVLTGDASVTLTYFVGLIGPANKVVPIDFMSAASVSGSIGVNEPGTGLYAYSQLTVNTDYFLQGTVKYLDKLNIDTNVGPSSDNFQPLTTVDAIAATSGIGAVFVTMTVFVEPTAEGYNGNQTNTSMGAASLDPYFFIDPGFANASQYSLTFSPGVGNAPFATPEPGPLVALSLGLLPLMRRRRK